MKLKMISLILVIIFFIDFKHFIIPDELNYLLVFLGLVKNFLSNFQSSFLFDIYQSLLGGFIGFIIIFAIIKLYLKFKNVEAMGLGDAKYMIFVGLMFGWQANFYVLFYAAILGLIFSIPSLIRNKKSMQSQIPFGPFLIISTLIYYFTGNFLF